MANNQPPVTTEPPTGVWVLDDRLEHHYFLNSGNLAKALLGGYGTSAQRTGRNINRAASLQWFGIDGHCDLTHELMDQKWPENQPDTNKDPVARNAQDRFMRGDKADWLKLRKAADKQDTADRKALTLRIEALRAQHLKSHS